MSKSQKIIGYKVFNPDWSCRGFKYEVGKTYKHENNIELCGSGFHFCKNAVDCFRYYDFNPENKVAEVHALGDLLESDDKCVTSKIKIIREINWHEVLELVNTGKGNTGFNNSGDRNSGDRNSGNCNSGNCNSGNCNSGDCNTGFFNSGDCNTGFNNSGDCNTGDRNSGDWNSGNWNSGDWNSGFFNACNWSSGLFNSKDQRIHLFNKESKLTMRQLQKKYPLVWNEICYFWDFYLTKWVYPSDMTADEKKQNPDYKTTNGYLKTLDYKDACQEWWSKLHQNVKDEFMNLPNFNKKVFKDITGIKV